MNTDELIWALEFEYYSILAANPNWDQDLVAFLRSREVNDEDIWCAFPEEAEQAGIQPLWACW